MHSGLLLVVLFFVVGTANGQTRSIPKMPNEVPPCVTPEAWIPKLDDPIRDQNGNWVDDAVESSGDQVLDLILCLNDCPSDADRARIAAHGSIGYESPFTSLMTLEGVAKVDAITLGGDPRVAFVQLDRPLSYSLDTSNAAIKVTTSALYNGETLEDAYPALRGQGVCIAVIDSGIDFGHESLPLWKFAGGWDFGSLPGRETNPDDTNGHGTHVASIAAGLGGPNGSRGVAPLADIVDLRVDPPTEARVIAAIDKCIERQSDWNIQVINLSLGGSQSSDGTDPTSVAADRAVEAGMVVVAAVGNDKERKIPGPAAGDRVIAVAALDDQGTVDRRDDAVWCDSLIRGSNYGPRLDDSDGQTEDERKPTCAAPGRSIRAARWDSTTGYDVRSGTSMAAPQVAGVAALILQQFPGMDPTKVRQRIVSSSEPLGGGRWEPDVGYGQIDAFVAVDGGTVENLGLAGYWSATLANGRAVMNVSESGGTGQDLNGDGDTDDEVMHIFDPQTAMTTNLGISRGGDSTPEALGNFLAFETREIRENVDLNGDGDLDDYVLHTYDDTTGDLVNVGLATTSIRVGADFVGFRVSESRQGETDLNGDGDTDDLVLHILNRTSGRVVNHQYACGYVQATDRSLVFVASENRRWDWNGDGDERDSILFFYDAETGVISNTGLPTHVFNLERDWVLFPVREEAHGATDLNGDGDTRDYVVHSLHLPTGATRNLGLAGYFNSRVDDGLVAVRVDEDDQGGSDLNGDGDDFDPVLFIHDLTTGLSTNLGLSVGGFAALDAGRLAFPLIESRQGGTDFNGDGDANDRVLHVVDVSTNMATNLGIAVHSNYVTIRDGRLIYYVEEDSDGDTDYNGDGDATDLVVQVYSLPRGTTHNLGLACSEAFEFRFAGSQVLFEVSEVDQANMDLNGDGDALDDYIFHSYDLRTQEIVNHELATILWLSTDIIFFEVWEYDQGGADLNGDGDAEDHVLHLLRDL